MAKETEYSVFAKILATKYRKNRKVDVFSKELFQKIYLPTEEDDPVDETLPRTFRGYYYGENDITELASNISESLDKENFAKYIQTESDDTIDYLCKSFRQWYPDISIDNYSQLIAKRFEDIIDNAATSKTKTAPPTIMVAGRSVDSRAIDYDELKRKYGTPLVAEAYGECTNEGCTNSLYIRSGNTLVEDYSVAVIDPAMSPEDTNNLIAMCPTCGKIYAASADDAIIARIKEIKYHLIQEAEAKDELSHEKIELGIRNVLRKVKDLDADDVDDDNLNYDPVMVNQKIERKNKQLRFKIKSNVAAFYLQIDDILHQYGREGIIDFDMFCLQVKISFKKLKKHNLPQTVIFENLVKWLMESTHEELEPCEAVISYFVQKCEVFDVIAKQAVLV